jgi:hypothetical protein
VYLAIQSNDDATLSICFLIYEEIPARAQLSCLSLLGCKTVLCSTEARYNWDRKAHAERKDGDAADSLTKLKEVQNIQVAAKNIKNDAVC